MKSFTTKLLAICELMKLILFYHMICVLRKSFRELRSHTGLCVKSSSIISRLCVLAEPHQSDFLFSDFSLSPLCSFPSCACGYLRLWSWHWGHSESTAKNRPPSILCQVRWLGANHLRSPDPQLVSTSENGARVTLHWYLARVQPKGLLEVLVNLCFGEMDSARLLALNPGQ